MRLKKEIGLSEILLNVRIFIFKAWIVSEKSDIEIVRDIKNGSVSAFQELYSRYADIVYRNILARVNSSFDADDIFQDFFIQVWEKRDSFQVSSSVKGYLLIWLRNHILNSIKQEQIRDKYQDICAPNEEDNYTWLKIVAKDLDENIRRIVDGFPPRLQCVYMLRQEQNLSIKEIAEKLAVSEQTVKNQLGDITRRLRYEVSRKNFLFFI